MVTQEQAVSAGSTRAEFHFTGRHQCTRTVGPRGGITERITVARVNGACRTWARDPQRFRLPVKHGLYEYGEIADYNAGNWHRAEDCPLNAASRVVQFPGRAPAMAAD